LVRKWEGKNHLEDLDKNLKIILKWKETGWRRLAMGWMTGVRFRVPVGSRIFCSPYFPEQLWGLPSLLSKGTGGSFPRAKVVGT
jgi:hypothetical protein